MSSEKGSSKADTLVKVVLVFFISLLSFSVGTFVGKQVSDSDHRRMALESEYKADRSVASTSDHGDAAHAEEKITEKEVESLTEEFVNKEKAASTAAEADAHAAAGHDSHVEEAAAPEAAAGYKAYPRGKGESLPAAKEHAAPIPAKAQNEKSHRKPTSTETPKADAEEHGGMAAAPVATKGPDAVGKAADKVAADKAPTDGAAIEKSAPPQLPSVASSAVGKYTVQVASYADEKEAKEHAAGLKGKGWNAFYLPAVVSGKTWYRVLVGLFNNDASAKEFRAQFMKETSTKSAIVQKIIQ